MAGHVGSSPHRAWLALLGHLVGMAAVGAAPAAEAEVDFAAQVAPLLAARCGACHGPREATSGYRIDLRDQAFAGGDSGMAGIVAGEPSASGLFVRIATDDRESRMPADGPPLSADEQAILREWIAAGAVWPDSLAALPESLLPRAAGPSSAGADHWAFQPPQRPRVPSVPGLQPANPIDAFIAAALAERGLAFNPEVDPRSLVRRVSFDLIGLPPTPEEIAAFEEGCRRAGGTEEPYRELVERLLASPHHGERWARHWLDVVRFAESDGFETNTARPQAWPYRDWVIAALNADRPFDEFVKAQIAGDATGDDAATGFLVGGPCDRVTSPDVVLTANQRADELHDMVSTTAAAFLGLTVGCARCHDHKFDPVPQTDYYRIKAVFAGVQHGERPVPGLRNAAAGPPERPSPVAQAEPAKPDDAPRAYVGIFVQPGPTHRLFRGDPLAVREVVAPGGLTRIGRALCLDEDAPEQERRKQLAAWIASADNPLTARVIANRLWHYHFGTGIVDTPSDLGVNGGTPSHRDLLDWLAAELISAGWRLKHLHRIIVTSRAYRQSTAPRADGLAADSASRLLWRYPPRRLEAEPLRDAILAVSGALDRRMGGPGFDLFEPNTNYVKVYTTKEVLSVAEFRRMVYQSKPRGELDTFFGAFDCPDAGQPQPKRTVSTTPLQALSMLNGTFLLDQAARFASRVEREAGSDPEAQVRRAMLLAFGREPAAGEVAAGAALVRGHGLPALCRSLYNTSEFITLY